VLRELVTSGRLNEEVYYGQTPAQIAAGMGNLKALQWLLDAGADPRQALCGAANNGRADVTGFLIARGCDVEERKNGMTPLMWAVHFPDELEDHLEVVRLLLGHGADVNAVSAESSAFCQAGQSVLRIAGGQRDARKRPKGPAKLIALLEGAGAKLNP
jgi:ankyrin repeat protein